MKTRWSRHVSEVSLPCSQLTYKSKTHGARVKNAKLLPGGVLRYALLASAYRLLVPFEMAEAKLKCLHIGESGMSFIMLRGSLESFICLIHPLLYWVISDFAVCLAKFPPLCSDMSVAGRRMCTVMLQLKTPWEQLCSCFFFFFSCFQVVLTVTCRAWYTSMGFCIEASTACSVAGSRGIAHVCWWPYIIKQFYFSCKWAKALPLIGSMVQQFLFFDTRSVVDWPRQRWGKYWKLTVKHSFFTLQSLFLCVYIVRENLCIWSNVEVCGKVQQVILLVLFLPLHAGCQHLLSW